jgi:nucleoside-diphosphate-sugar epimerase
VEGTDEPVAVTGAGGFVGLAVCRRLVDDGHPVLGPDLDGHARERVAAAGARFARCDVTDPQALERGLDEVALVVHTAARVSEWGVARVRRRPPPFGRAGVVFLSRHAAYPNTRARGLLGSEPAVALKEGMRRTEAWFRAEGMLDDG